jgi:hypothetical protein
VGSEGNMAQFKAIRNKGDMEDAILRCVPQVTQKLGDEHGYELLLHLELLAFEFVNGFTSRPFYRVIIMNKY